MIQELRRISVASLQAEAAERRSGPYAVLCKPGKPRKVSNAGTSAARGNAAKEGGSKVANSVDELNEAAIGGLLYPSRSLGAKSVTVYILNCTAVDPDIGKFGVKSCVWPIAPPDVIASASEVPLSSCLCLCLCLYLCPCLHLCLCLSVYLCLYLCLYLICICACVCLYPCLCLYL